MEKRKRRNRRKRDLIKARKQADKEKGRYINRRRIQNVIRYLLDQTWKINRIQYDELARQVVKKADEEFLASELGGPEEGRRYKCPFQRFVEADKEKEPKKKRELKDIWGHGFWRFECDSAKQIWGRICQQVAVELGLEKEDDSDRNKDWVSLTIPALVWTALGLTEERRKEEWIKMLVKWWPEMNIAGVELKQTGTLMNNEEMLQVTLKVSRLWLLELIKAGYKLGTMYGWAYFSRKTFKLYDEEIQLWEDLHRHQEEQKEKEREQRWLDREEEEDDEEEEEPEVNEEAKGEKKAVNKEKGKVKRKRADLTLSSTEKKAGKSKRK